jgi:molecular chaperone GrpE
MDIEKETKTDTVEAKDTEQKKHDDSSVELVECQDQLAKLKNMLAHVAADFENYKRRSEKERGMWMHSAQALIISDVLSIVDDFERAIAQEQENEDLLQGLKMIYSSLKKFLEKHQVLEIQTDVPFDPERHEALTQVESKEKESGSIVDVMQKGYSFKDKVLRPAKVAVAK